MEPKPLPEDVTRLLRRLASGDRSASEQLFDVLYPHLRELARSQMRGAGSGGTLQPTALVHEAWLRLERAQGADWHDREHFLAAAATAMRCALVDLARRRKAQKRGGGRQRVPLREALDEEDLEGTLELFENRAIDLIALDEALVRLADLDPRQARVVELCFFAGMNMEEAARALECSRATAERSWYQARSWLRRQLAG
jgi:RNA polymerase sigma factor (TIGR02999 family)